MGFLALVFTSIVDTVPLSRLVTKAVLPSGVTATAAGVGPTVMSVGFLVLSVTSIVDTVPLPGPRSLGDDPHGLDADGDGIGYDIYG